MNNRVAKQYEEWVQYAHHVSELSTDLKQMAGNEPALIDAFYRDLEFGTGGMRGVLGAGTNRMNVYTVRKATLGLARYLQLPGHGQVQKRQVQNRQLQGQGQSQDCGSRLSARLKVAIGYDCRRMSAEFALEAGRVLSAQGIEAAIFEHLCPTPELSFAVRQLQADAGIMITASHNPPEYNGYKVYGPDGGQILPEAADLLTAEISGVEKLFDIPLLSKVEAEQAGFITWLGQPMDAEYHKQVLQATSFDTVTDEQRKALNLVYSPLHGTGNVPVREVLQNAGYRGLTLVDSQTAPDGEFPTVKSPNPEEPAAFAVALETARVVNADIVLATDPDADRVGVAVRDANGDYTLLTGNQTGGLLLDFLLRQKKQSGGLPPNPIVFKTIVTSDLGAVVAKEYGVAVEDTLTGFKYIGERINYYEQTGEKQFLFGYEESYGYLLSPLVRDKDAVQSCLAIAEMAAHYKSSGKTLLQALDELYQRVGYFQEELISATMPGAEGLNKIQTLMLQLRTKGLPGDLVITSVEDYELGQRTIFSSSGREGESLSLPKANVLKYGFENGSWLAVRPSGTEPKIKFYLGAKEHDLPHCQQQLARLRETTNQVLASVQAARA